MTDMTIRRSFLLLAAFFVACGGGDDAPDADSAAVPVDTATTSPVVLAPSDIATVETGTIGSSLTISGNLDPADIVHVRAQVPGVVQNVRVDRGSSVRAGAVMAVIEAAGVRTQAAAARAQEAVARQRLEASKRLFEAGAISNIEYQTAQAGYEAARAASAGAAESAARATIRAPISGVVSARAVSGGEAVNPGTPLFTVVNARELELAGRVGVQEAGRVRAGQPVVFRLESFPGETFRGRVARVDPTADAGTRQVGVYVTLNNASGRIVGGQYATGSIETGRAASALVIPESALSSRSGQSAVVYVVAGNKVARRTITVGARDENTGRITVTSGLQAGERVLLNPSPDMGDGTTIAIAADSAARR
jgi:membrane fusion protein (multidrug efflux system)